VSVERGSAVQVKWRDAILGVVLSLSLFYALAQAQGGSAKAGRSSAMASTSTARPWQFAQRLGRSKVELSFVVSVCNKQTVPEVRSKVVERPGRAVITILVSVSDPPPGTLCLRSLRRKKINLQLGAPLATLKLFDGSYSPPKRRWPL
jgi:hypothetical protein